ncbi:MAG: phenylalanine--tRNA ligase subunit beta [Candidatus Aminicenantales bacterium]
MRISLNWLRDYVAIEEPLSGLIDKLNSIGLLVEDWEEKDGDVILDIETYANRPDTLGHLGVAREVAAAFGLKLQKKTWTVVEGEEETSNLVNIQIRNEDLCRRYCGLIVNEVKVGPSPAWLKARLEAVGFKSINNVVDITNYVLWATAQPLHAFDYDKIKRRKIIVRRAEPGETLITLEGEKLLLAPEMLVIADAAKPVALAGIIGGQDSAVSETTHRILIESAYFEPTSIRQTSRKTGISTEASYRFERGADLSFQPEAARMAASLLTQLGGKATKGVVDVYPKPRKRTTVILRHHRLSELLGVEIGPKFVIKTLASLGFKIKEQSPGIWQIQVPSFRVDIEREADLIEEVARFFGFDKIPARIPPLRQLEPPPSAKRKRIDKLRQLLFHQGFDEFLNFSFFDPAKKDQFIALKQPIALRNPISSKASWLRPTLLAGLLENVVWNRNRGAEGVHAFEIGNIYFWDKEKGHEQLSLAFVSTGRLGWHHWQEEEKTTDFFHLKGTCELILSYLRYEPFVFFKESHPYFEPQFCLGLSYKGETVGHLGLIKRQILDSYSLKEDVWGAEIDLAALLDKQPSSFRYQTVSRYPSVIRDISFLAPRGVNYQDVKDVLEKISLPNLEKFELYDLFSGPSLPPEKISLSFRFIFRHPRRTLRAQEVDKYQQKIIDVLRTNFNFQIREGGEIDK